MNKSKVELFLDEFKEYIVDTAHTAGTADSYKSNLCRACRILNLGEGFLEAVVSITDMKIQASLCEYMRAKLTEAIENGSNKAPKGAISDCRSAVAMFQEFITAGGDSVTVASEDNVSAPVVSDSAVSEAEVSAPVASGESALTATVKFAPVVVLPYESVYSRKDMEKIFRQRLITQDRYYSDSCLPARIISKINMKRVKRKIYSGIISNTKFRYDTGSDDYVLLKDITKLTIKTDGFVKFESKGNEYDLYTEVYSGGRLVRYELMRVDSFSLLSLDHEIAIRNVLPDFLKTHGEFAKLSEKVLEAKGDRPDLTVSKFSKYFYETVYGTLSINENNLIDEVCRFIDSLKLVIMHRSYNSGKNDSI